MKNKRITILLIIINIILVGIICSLISKNGNIIKEKQIIKEMTGTEYDNSINELNKSHEEYAKKIQSYKVKLATAITNQGVETSENATIDEMTANIEKILQARTADATATADNITEGKTAYVNGELVVGNGADNNSYYNLGYTKGASDALNKTNISYIYHKHTGSSTDGTGCYTTPVYHSHTSSCYRQVYCNNLYSYKRDDGSTVNDYHGTCPTCGRDLCKAWEPGYVTCSNCVVCGKSGTIEQYSLSCGKTEETIESAVIIFN